MLSDGRHARDTETGTEELPHALLPYAGSVGDLLERRALDHAQPSHLKIALERRKLVREQFPSRVHRSATITSSAF
jgi:hypothetical protein